MATHEVLNQPPPLQDYNLYTSDRALGEAMEREGAGWAVARASELGATCGRAEVIEWGAQANASPPVLRTHDRYGHRVDMVDYHPAYHQLMRLSIGHGMHALPWREPRPGAHVARAAMFYLTSQVEAGHGCPISMTYSAVPALRVEAKVAREWEPRLTSTHYDHRFQPATEKQGALCGMAMTEKQGGSDVRANTSRAEKGDGGWLITGHKWFCSAPMCDAFLVLAQTAKGLTCFLLPRWLPDGTLNRFHVQRLKDKLGNRSNASSEVEFDRAWARRVGAEGRGVATIIEMVNHTRLDCTIGAASGMRQAVAQATHHAQHRSAFGKRLIEQALMQNVLADLCVESEAATAAMMRLARAYDARSDEGEGLFARLATAVVKYWVCKRWPAHAAEALECLGGSGYVEEGPLARLFRESPLNGIWEGSGNVICLDVLRAMAKGPEVVEAFFAEIDRAHGADPRLDQFVLTLRDDLGDAEAIEARARDLVERMAVALQGSLLVRDGDPAVAEAFCASRLAGQHRLAFGTLPPGFHFTRIIERARPTV
ncbi:MAG TPA: isovaleryl-CoA dehydrogenase [Candidatus Dormibacteraeota bacterium]|nr:isovaleryl-CoA dehydrogenase [Candidatus Dormibacteraeota bacterium]